MQLAGVSCEFLETGSPDLSQFNIGVDNNTKGCYLFMKFHETRVRGVFEIHLEPVSDERGFFARSWCQKEFEAHGLNANLVQCNVSLVSKRGRCGECTIRLSLIRRPN